MTSGPSKLRAFGRRLDPFAVDCAAAVLLLAVGALALGTAHHVRLPFVQALWGIAVAATVAVRRRWLLQAAAVALVAAAAAVIAFGSASVHGPAGFIGAVAAVLIAYGAGAFLEGPRSLLALAMILTVLSIVALTSSSQVVANVLWNVAIAGLLPWSVGRMMRERSARARASLERAERLDSEHELHQRAAALGERARLAREIHDVIAHSVSVMVIQAAGARTVMDRDPDRAEMSLRSVERAGRDALAEMRRLLGVLGDREELRMLAPQPSLDDLDELVARTRAAGLGVSCRVEGEPVVVSPGLSLCAYRIVQEALTNTMKHAGPVRARVLVRWDPAGLGLEIIDDGPGSAAPVPAGSGGHGIAGMRERAAMHGGTVEAGAGASGGFFVRARLPLLEQVAA